MKIHFTVQRFGVSNNFFFLNNFFIQQRHINSRWQGYTGAHARPKARPLICIKTWLTSVTAQSSFRSTICNTVSIWTESLNLGYELPVSEQNPKLWHFILWRAKISSAYTYLPATGQNKKLLILGLKMMKIDIKSKKRNTFFKILALYFQVYYKIIVFLFHTHLF